MVNKQWVYKRYPLLKVKFYMFSVFKRDCLGEEINMLMVSIQCLNWLINPNTLLSIPNRCSTEGKSEAYSALVRHQREYACSVWNQCTRRNIHHIELVQHRTARFVFRDYRKNSHVTPTLKQLGWDTLEQRRLSYQLSMFYKIQRGLVGIYLPSEVCSLTRASRAPNAFPFHHIWSSCNVYKYSSFPSSIVASNKLPVTTDIFPFTNSIMPTVSSVIRSL